MADSTITVTDVALGGKKLKTAETDSVHTLKVDASDATIPVSGTVAVSSVAGTVTVSGTATVSATNLDIRDLTSASDSVTIQGGNSTAVKVDGSDVTQPVSGTVTSNQGTAGAAYWLASAKFVDENGTAYGVKHISNKPRVSAMPYTYDISEGNVTNHTAWSKIGYNAAIGATEEMMWPVSTAYTWPAAELTMTIVSDSAEDDPDKGAGVPGTGAWTVAVYYLDDAFAEKKVTVTMNGTSAVTIGTDVYRIQNIRVVTAGTGNAAAGTLTVANGGTTYGSISAGRTRARQCLWTVPAGKVLYVTDIAFSCADQSAGKYARFTTKANYDNLAGTVLQRGLFMPFNEIILNNTAINRPLDPPTKLPATVDLYVAVLANSAAQGTCTLRGWVETA